MDKSIRVNKAITNSNQLGVALIMFGTLTNDFDDLFQNVGIQVTDHIRPTTLTNYITDLKGFSPLEDEYISLINTTRLLPSIQEDHTIILNFASKIIKESKDIDPEINLVVRKHFWDLI